MSLQTILSQISVEVTFLGGDSSFSEYERGCELVCEDSAILSLPGTSILVCTHGTLEYIGLLLCKVKRQDLLT